MESIDLTPTVEIPSLFQFLVRKQEELGLKMVSMRTDGSEYQYQAGEGYPAFQVYDIADGEERTTVLRLFIKNGVVPDDIPVGMRRFLAAYNEAMNLWLDNAPIGQRRMTHKIDLRYVLA